MGDLPSKIVASIAFVGRTNGMVKGLAGFKKSHHTLPDAANAVTNAFLGKICATEIAAAAESLFQRARTELGYKRKEISLSLASPTALLISKDFALEISYALEETDPSRYTVVTTLRDLRSSEFIETAECDALFARMFTELVFGLANGVAVEAVIDAIESLDAGEGLAVAYPSDAHDCNITVPGVEAHVRCTSSTLEIIFPRASAPGELLQAFAKIRHAFSLSRELSGLLS